MTNTNQNWEEELNKWLETQDHKHNCIGYSEGTGCCLDVDDDDDSLYAGTARPFLKALVKKVEQQAKEQGRREGIEECDRHWNQIIAEVAKKGLLRFHPTDFKTTEALKEYLKGKY